MRSSGAQARTAPSSNGALWQTAIFPHSMFHKNLAQPSSIPFLFPFVSLSIFIAVISRSALRAVLCAQKVCERKEVRKKARKRGKTRCREKSNKINEQNKEKCVTRGESKRSELTRESVIFRGLHCILYTPSNLILPRPYLPETPHEIHMTKNYIYIYIYIYIYRH